MSYLERYLSKQVKKDSGAIAFLAGIDYLQERSPEVAAAILKELKDQRTYLKLIASENYCSLAVQLAMGNLLTDKYSEGYPHHRFYAGCENVDTLEDLAANELKKIFHCDHAYVQPHSGADANMIAFWAILVQRVQNREVEKLGKKSVDELSKEEYERVRGLLLKQKVLGMALGSGGHLTHGYRHNLSSKIMQASSYEVDRKTEMLDYKALEKQVLEEKPDILIAGYSSYPRLINFAKMREIADRVGAVLLVDMAHFAGLVAGKVMRGDYDPIAFAQIVTSTTHKTLRGPRGGLILCKEEYRDTVNKGCPLVIGGPLPHVIAAKAVAFQEANTPSFQKYAQQIVLNTQALVETFLQHKVKLFSGGSDNHLLVLDVAKSFALTGRQAEKALREAFFTVNRNMIPFDENGPWYTSGVRIGTPALTTLGMKEKEMKEIAETIVKLLKHTKPAEGKAGEKQRAQVIIDPSILTSCQEDVKRILRHYPLYPELEIA